MLRLARVRLRSGGARRRGSARTPPAPRWTVAGLGAAGLRGRSNASGSGQGNSLLAADGFQGVGGELEELGAGETGELFVGGEVWFQREEAAVSTGPGV